MLAPTIITIEITAPETVPITEIIPTPETALITEIVSPITTEHHLHSLIETVTQPETTHKDNPEAITLNTIDRTQVKTTNVHQTVTHQATTPTEVTAAAAAVCQVVADIEVLEEECLAAAEECPAVAAEDDNIYLLEIN
jgi:hypothetical protein